MHLPGRNLARRWDTDPGTNGAVAIELRPQSAAPVRRWRLLLVFFFVVLALTISTYVPSPYVKVAGAIHDVAGTIVLPEQKRHPVGSIAYAAVTVERLTYGAALFGAMIGNARVVSAESAPSLVSSTAAQRKAFEQSKASAIVVAMRRAGYDVQCDLTGVMIEGIRADSSSSEALVPSDVIVAVDGEAVGTVSAFEDRVSSRGPQATVELNVLRAMQFLRVVASTEPRRIDDQAPMGLTVHSWAFGLHLPFDVELRTPELFGGSAGLIFALGLLDALTPGDLVHSLHVAGTGTLDIDGRVGSVTGVEHKIVAAERAGTDVFFVPRENAAEARAAAKRVRVIDVSSFDDAVDALLKMGGTLTEP